MLKINKSTSAPARNAPRHHWRTNKKWRWRGMGADVEYAVELEGVEVREQRKYGVRYSIRVAALTVVRPPPSNTDNSQNAQNASFANRPRWFGERIC